MARHRDFEAAKQNKELITFGLGGENFTCIAEAPAGIMMDFVADASEGGAKTLPAMLAFLRGVLIEDDTERFDKMIYDKTVQINTTVIADLVVWLTEEYTGRPTERPLDSTPGPQATGAI